MASPVIMAVSMPLPVAAAMMPTPVPMAVGVTYAVGSLIPILLTIWMCIGVEEGLVVWIDRLHRHVNNSRRNIGRGAMNHARMPMHDHRRLMHDDWRRVVARRTDGDRPLHFAIGSGRGGVQGQDSAGNECGSNKRRFHDFSSSAFIKGQKRTEYHACPVTPCIGMYR
jgi:hypothetical protein